MKTTVFMPVMCIGIFSASQSAIGIEPVARCTLGSDGSHTLTLLRDHPTDGTAVYYLSKDGASPVRLYPGDEGQSRGDEIQAVCVGERERAFVLSGEFTSNFLQGVAVRYNARAKRWERIDFAERTRPASVYFDAKGLSVLLPNTGRNESPERYIIYRYDASTGNAEQTYSDRVPKLRATRIPEYKLKTGRIARAGNARR
ncbi:hypothetical protein [Paraburkholderia guartelaensis]|uniref:hypothetical protein n=1 Tax=Paraburkholderia guartelaensis TaxID=2546446 RepID=UPI002AB7C2A3|nr:hypothetical protein [Paraburkholderia guartelaensis]